MKRIVLSPLFLIFFFVCYSQQKWKNYTAADYINCFAFDKDTVWIGSDGGVAKYLTNGTRLATYTRADGLIQDYVTGIAIDSLHNKWFTYLNSEEPGFGAGVTKFDGSNWTNYNSSNSTLENRFIDQIVIDRQGNKWFLDNVHFYKFNDITWEIFSNTDSALAHGFSPIIDSHGSVWYYSTTELVKFNGTSRSQYAFPAKALTIGYLNGCLIDSHDNLWIYGEAAGPHTNAGIFKFDGTNWFDESNSLGISGARLMIIDRTDNLWFGGGSCIFEYNGDSLLTICNSYADSTTVFPYTICFGVDGQNQLWVGNEILIDNINDFPAYPTQNVWMFDGTNWIYLDPGNSPLNSNAINSIAADHHNNVWVSTYYGADYKIDSTNWMTNDCIGEVGVIDNQNNIWGLNGTSIVKFDGTNCFTYDDQLIDAEIISAAIDQQGIAWCAVFAGPYDGDILKFDGTNWYIAYDANITGSSALEVFVDKQNNKWFSTRGASYAVRKYDGTSWTNYTQFSNGELYNYVTAMAQDIDGAMWFGTYNGGIARFDGANWIIYDSSNSGLPGNQITALAIDKRGIKWLGTSEVASSCTGVVRFDDEIWTNYTAENSGLSEDCINSITVDEQGNVWIGTGSSGISELLNTDTTFAVWLNFNGNICDNNSIVLNPVTNFGDAPYSYSWQAIGDTISCNNCEHPTTVITQTSRFIVQVTDSKNEMVTDTLVVQPCLATGITQSSNENAAMEIYPNPFNSSVNVMLQKQNLKQASFTVFNVLGQPVYTEKINHVIDGKSTTILNLNNLPDGFYFIETIADGQKIVSQVVKQ